MKILAELFSRVPRNFRGGFLCGFVGILSFWVAYPHSPAIAYVALIVCSFTATVIGFWLEESVQLFRERWTQIMALRSLPHQIKVAAVNGCHRTSSNLQRKLRLCADLFTTCYKAVAAIPPWFRKDRWRIAVLLSFGAILVNYAIHAVWIWLVYSNHTEMFSSAGKSDSHVLMVVGITIGCCLIFFVPMFKFGAERLGSKARRRCAFRMQLYQVGPMRFFGRKLFELFVGQLIVISGAAVVLTFLAVYGALSLSIVIIPFALAIFPIRGIYKLATQPNHWPTFAVGICTTFASIWLFEPQFADFRYAVVIAVGAGLASGVAVYGLSKAVEAGFAALPRLHQFAFRPFGEHAALIWLGRIIFSPTTDGLTSGCMPKRVFSY